MLTSYHATVRMGMGGALSFLFAQQITGAGQYCHHFITMVIQLPFFFGTAPNSSLLYHPSILHSLLTVIIFLIIE